MTFHVEYEIQLQFIEEKETKSKLYKTNEHLIHLIHFY